MLLSRLLQLLAVTSSVVLAAPVIKLPCGSTITGSSAINADGGAVNTFLGIPFAEPPVGELRWRQTNLKPVAGDIDATAVRAACFGSTVGDNQSEDCLFLNIYAPADATSASKLPVFVWVHGGAFQGGSPSLYDGSNLIGNGAQQRVVITVGYRLGLFGFFSNADILKEGNGANFGLRDQEIGFNWIKQYVQYFGGNPDDITAFGESAGSISLATHMISRDGDQKLFHKVILQSGAYLSAHDASPVSIQARDTASVGERMNCSSSQGFCLKVDSLEFRRVNYSRSSQGSVMDCLRRADATTLIKEAGKDFWTPSIDGVFMYEMPIKRVQAGKVSQVPVIIGTTTDEGWFFTFGQEDADQFEAYLLKSFPLMTVDEVKRAALLYPKASFETGQHRIAEAFGDATFVCPTDLFALATAKSAPTYRYRFDYVASSGSFLPTPPGIILHLSDVFYIFQSGHFTTPTDNVTLTVSDFMRKYWTTFVHTASPNGDGKSTNTGLPQWPLYDDASKNTLHFQEQISVETSGRYMPLHDERCAFWYDVDARLATVVDQ